MRAKSRSQPPPRTPLTLITILAQSRSDHYVELVRYEPLTDRFQLNPQIWKLLQGEPSIAFAAFVGAPESDQQTLLQDLQSHLTQREVKPFLRLTQSVMLCTKPVLSKSTNQQIYILGNSLLSIPIRHPY